MLTNNKRIFYKKKEKIKDMKISFFKNFIWFISLILFLFFSSFFLVSITYFDHKNEVITYENIEIYKTNEIQNFNAYFENNDLYIIICLNETKDDFFLLDYAYYYFFKYEKNIYLEASYNNQVNYIVINNNGIASFLINVL